MFAVDNQARKLTVGADPTAFGPLLTIGPDYRPYILPPESMTDWANSIYSTSGCQIQVNGVW